MPGNEHAELRRLFDAVIEAPQDTRGHILERECRGDTGLRKRVEAMIAAAEGGEFLSEATVAHVQTTPTPAAGEGPGTRIGQYKLLQQIGEGGFGSVFMAEQERPVQRKVALKIIKLGMDTKAVIARFEAERQALAMMDHPNIARVLDAGATELGRPYFVMELCKGDPIAEYCDRNNLSIEDRLELFAQVCTAVQHAHTKGIIHRDIKPSNVLVSTQDGRPHAKVIDFGIAKATASKLTEKTLFTEHRQLIGTPEYMSPEQAEGSLDIDTRTDVYSLGVLLYELLTGTTPFSGKDLRSAAFGEIQRIIREVEPPKPSTRLNQSTETIAGVAARRHTEPRRLESTVRGELDWIVMKAMEKDRARRYETANGLAIDIRRYLAGEAIAAAPPSAAYQLRTFVRRHRVMVTAGGAVAAALLLGATAFAWQASVARNQRDKALEAQRQADEQRIRAVAAEASALANEKAAREARDAATENARLAESQATLALGTLQGLITLTQSKLDAPGTSGFKKDVMDLALANVSKVSENYNKSTSKEATTAAIHKSLGDLLLRLGQSDKALERYQRVLEIAQERVKIKEYSDPSRQNLAAAHMALADVKQAVGRDMTEVLSHNREALRLWQDIRDHPKNDGYQVDRGLVAIGVAENEQRVGTVLYRVGDLDGAASHFRAALALREEMLRNKPDDPTMRHETAFSYLATAEIAFHLGENEEARRWFARCLTLRESLLASAPTSATAKSEVGDAHYMLGRFMFLTGDLEQGWEHLERSRQIRQERVDADGAVVDYRRALGLSLYLLAQIAERRGDDKAAADLFGKTREIRVRLAESDPANDRRQIELMTVLPRVGDVAGAIAIADRMAALPKLDNELRIDLARCFVQCARATPAPPGEAAAQYRARAMQILRDAVQAGFSDRVILVTDPDLAPLAGEPEFVALLDGLRKARPSQEKP